MEEATVDTSDKICTPLTFIVWVAHFVRRLYRGFFHDSERNYCENQPEKCTGHIVDAPCDWYTNVKGQLYWNNIALDPDGPRGTVGPNNNYTMPQKVDIWHAANETKSHVMMVWYTPDSLVESLCGSPGEFVSVTIQKPTLECITSGTNATARC